MNVPGLYVEEFKAGEWIGNIYVADVSGGKVVTVSNPNWPQNPAGREEIAEFGRRMRTQRRMSATKGMGKTVDNERLED